MSGGHLCSVLWPSEEKNLHERKQEGLTRFSETGCSNDGEGERTLWLKGKGLKALLTPGHSQREQGSDPGRRPSSGTPAGPQAAWSQE